MLERQTVPDLVEMPPGQPLHQHERSPNIILGIQVTEVDLGDGEVGVLREVRDRGAISLSSLPRSPFTRARRAMQLKPACASDAAGASAPRCVGSRSSNWRMKISCHEPLVRRLALVHGARRAADAQSMSLARSSWSSSGSSESYSSAALEWRDIGQGGTRRGLVRPNVEPGKKESSCSRLVCTCVVCGDLRLHDKGS